MMFNGVTFTFHCQNIAMEMGNGAYIYLNFFWPVSFVAVIARYRKVSSSTTCKRRFLSVALLARMFLSVALIPRMVFDL